MYLGLTDIHSDQLSAAVFIFHSAYKLISCCFPFAPWSFVSAVCLLTGLCNEAWRTCETAGEPKRVCSLIWIFQTLWWKVELEFSPPHCTKNVSLTPAFFWWPWRVDVECRFRRNRPMVFSARILNFHRVSAMFEKTTVYRRAFWVKKCDGFASKVIWITSWGNMFVLSFRIQCVKLE